MLRNPATPNRSLVCALTLIFALLSAFRDARAGDFFDKLHDTLSLSDPDHHFHLQLSGLIDLETYFIDEPAPALLYTDDDVLFNPRLTLFLDAQLGSKLYVFAQTRLDRGFDPTDSGPQIRLDEYFLRYTPDRSFNVQIGQFATVVGNWVLRHDSWQNPFINAPLPYENLTGMWDVWAPEKPEDLLYWAHVPGYESGVYDDKILRLPIIWGPNYASGISVFGSVGNFDYGAEMKNASLSSRPDVWSITETGFSHPTFSSRIGFRPNEMWNFGFSVSDGSYFIPEAEPSFPPGTDRDDYKELVLAQDISFAWHHLQLWAEFFETRFEVPNVGDADTFAYYLEAKYKITPQLFGALRWNQQLFGTIVNNNQEVPWGNDIWRIDAAIGYRFTDHLQAKIQYSFSEQDSPQEGKHLVAVQATLKF